MKILDCNQTKEYGINEQPLQLNKMSEKPLEVNVPHWLAIGGTFTVASGNELTKPRQNMKVKTEPLAFFQSL